MSVFRRCFPLPIKPGVYVPEGSEAHRTLVMSNNALDFGKVMRALRHSEPATNLLCVDTYGLEPDGAALQNLFSPERILKALREIPALHSKECLLLFRQGLSGSEQEAFEKQTRRTIAGVTLSSVMAAGSDVDVQPSARNYTLDRQVSLNPSPLLFSQRLCIGLANALLVTVLAGLCIALFQLWSLWPILLVIVGLGVLLPAVYEVLPFRWGVLRGFVWGGMLAVLWYGMSQFVWLIPPDTAGCWALVIMAVATWIGRGIYRPWRSLMWENAAGLAVCVVTAAVGLLW